MKVRARPLVKFLLRLLVVLAIALVLLALPSQKIDWHDYKSMEDDVKRRGLGEQGEPAILLGLDNVLEEAIFNANGYNGYVSDQISLNRSLPDTRHFSCKHKQYPADLPTVSAIVPFWNEHFSTLLRTVQSMLNRAPQSLLLEVILVNDFSDNGFEWSDMHDLVLQHYGDRVTVIHLKERMGLMAARTIGARAAKGDVLIFVDAHTEANVNWLPPLLEPISINYKTVTVPFVDNIDPDTFAYLATSLYGHRGVFDWKFLYHQLPRNPKAIEDLAEPFETPVMNGGLFAISAKWFWELGGYDSGLDIWGGEQFELSFKLWQCGGKMLDIPCARFGHVFRRERTSYKNPRDYEFLFSNYKRVAEVWMDDFAKYIYMRRSQYFRKVEVGDLSEAKAIREKLKCKSFQWYLNNVAVEVLTSYPPITPIFASGWIQSVANQSFCVTASQGQLQLKLSLCKGKPNNPTPFQRFQHTFYRDIEHMQDLCFDASNWTEKSSIMLFECHYLQGNQYWRYDRSKKRIYKNKDETVCLDSDAEAGTVFINECDESWSQLWEWGYVNQTLADNWPESGAKIL